jgi:uncharacterized membrane protein YdbT with pleckstrin-like domain
MIMGYIDDNLMSGEQVVYRTKLHWVIFLWPIICAVIAFMFFAGEGGTAAARGFFLLVAIIWGISSFISFKTSEFGITNKRVLIKVGFIRRNSLETLLTKVEGIQVNQGILGRILNYGTIIVKGTGGTSNPFHKIDAPLEFRKKVQEQIALKEQ